MRWYEFMFIETIEAKRLYEEAKTDEHWAIIERLFRDVVTPSSLVTEDFNDVAFNEIVNDLVQKSISDLKPKNFLLSISGTIDFIKNKVPPKVIQVSLVKPTQKFMSELSNKESSHDAHVSIAKILYSTYDEAVNDAIRLKFAVPNDSIFSFDDKVKLKETASAGASSAGGVATAVTGLGAGDPKASIYYDTGKKKKKKKEEKMPIIRRPNPVESQKD